jgi:uncharacterized protein
MRGLFVAAAVVSLQWAVPLPAQPPAARRPVTPRQVLVVHPLAYYEDGGQQVGICMQARLEIGGAPAGRVRIGVYEPEVGGTTDVWRAAAWSAALVAAQATDFDPRALQLSVEVGRSTDGPSAGALLTVGLISAIRGDALQDGVTMTGTINPDGTIGPVGGITLKIEGAAKAGKKTVLIPFGQETDADPRTGRQVNLVQYGWQQGVDVKPVHDVWQAYELFTGVALPRPDVVEVPKSSPEVHAIMLDRIERWIKLTKAAREKYDSWPQYTHMEFSESLMQQSRELFDRASQYLNSGDSTAAYMDVVSGSLYAWMAHEFGRYVYQLPSGSVEGLVRLPAQNEWLVKEIDETTLAMRAFTPRTFDQMAMYLNAGLVYFEGLCAFEIAEDLKTLHRSKYLQSMLAVEGDQNNSAQQLRQAMFSIFAGVFQIAAWIDMKLATDYLEVASRFEGQPLPEHPDLIKLADFYRRGAEANMTIVNDLSVIPAAREQEMPVEIARAILPLGDGFYGAAHVGLTRVLPSLRHRLGDGIQHEYVTLAASMYLHSTTAGLVAKYYSIGVEIGSDLKITKVHREAALQDWLAESRRQTERSIHALVLQGVDTKTPVQLYWLARTEENRPKPEEKFFALQRYFYANLMAQILGQLARPAALEAAAPVDAAAPPAPPQPAGGTVPPASVDPPAASSRGKGGDGGKVK